MWNLITNDEEGYDIDLIADYEFDFNSKGMSSYRNVLAV